MKTGTHLNSSQIVPAHSLPSRPNLRIRTGQADVLPQLSFKALFADIRPGAFEEMSKKALALRDEQARIEQARRRQKPREQDQFHASSPEPQRHTPAPGPQRSTSTVERARETSPAREAVRAPERTDARPLPERTATTEVNSPAGPDKATAGTGHVDHAVQADQHSGPGTPTAAQPQTRTVDGSQATAPHQPAGHGSSEAAGTDPSDSAGTTDLPQAVAEALAYLEEHHARQHAMTGGSPSGQGRSSLPQDMAQTADVAAEAAMMDAQMLAEPGSSTADAPRQMAQAAAAGAVEPALPTSEVSGEAAEADMPQALATLMGGMETSGKQSGQGRHQQSPAHPAVNLTQTASTNASAVGNTSATSVSVTAATAQATPTTPSAGSEGFSLTMVNGAGRAEAPAVGVALPVQSGHSPTRADGSPLLSSRIDAGIHTQEFREQFARQVAGLTVQGQDRAEIRLTPAELGPIRIRVSLSADDAQLDISAAQASTRAAIEASMSTLRQMLSEQGIRLAEYRMDQGQNPAFAQNRQSGQDLSSNLQQNGTAFGQGNEAGHPGSGDTGGRSTGRSNAAAGNGSVADPGRIAGSARSRMTTGNGRVDLFA